MLRWLGFFCIVGGAAATGFSMASDVRKKEEQLLRLLAALQYMKGEIEFLLTPVGQVCREISQQCANKPLRNVFVAVADDLERSPGRPVGQIMRKQLGTEHGIFDDVKRILTDLFSCLGRQDVYAQVRSIATAQQRAETILEMHLKEKNERRHSYRVLGVCTGLALAIILI